MHYDMDLFTTMLKGVNKDNNEDQDIMLGKKRTHEEAFGKDEESTPDKKPRLDNESELINTDKTPNQTSEKKKEQVNPDECKALLPLPDVIGKYKGKDILVNLKVFSDVLCKCNKCIDKYNTLKLNYLTSDFYSDWTNRMNLEEQLAKEAEEDTVENQAAIENLNTCELREMNAIKSLPLEKQVELSLVMKEFKEKFIEHLKTLGPDQKLVTGDVRILPL
jgi:hypothetical protein